MTTSRKIFLRLNTPAMLLLVAAMIPPICGCENEGYNDKRKYNLQSLLDSAKPESPTESVKDMFDTGDADKRRRGVDNLSSQSYGFKDSYMKGYAELLRSDEDSSVRAAAVRAIGKSGRKDYLPNVVAAMEDQSSSVRWDAAVALDNIVGDEAIDALREHVLLDENMDVRIACGKALRHYRGIDVYRALLQSLDDREFSVRYQAHATLVEIAGTDRGYNPPDWVGLIDGSLTPAPAKPPPRPWWDMAGVSGGQGSGQSQTQAQSRPAPPVSPPAPPTSAPTTAPAVEETPVLLPDYSTVKKQPAQKK